MSASCAPPSAYQRGGMGKAIVVGREDDVNRILTEGGAAEAIGELEVLNGRQLSAF